MSQSFNLISRPWIPCIRASGESCELGLRDVLVEAHEIREIRADSPLVTGSIHRLLIAILHRVFGPETDEALRALWQGGEFDERNLDGYFSQWEDRFDLFDPVRPFYQTRDAEIDEAAAHPTALVAHELASGNNDTLFDHSCKTKAQKIDTAAAARLLVAYQNYALGGGVSKPFNLSHAPLVAGALILLKGPSLFETLLLNLLVCDDETPVPGRKNDRPCWERDRSRPPAKRLPDGYLDYLTWQSRRILLAPEGDAGVETVQVLQGDAIPVGEQHDPMMALKCRDPERGFMPLRVSTDRALWRDSHALVASAGEFTRRPMTLEQVSRQDWLTDYPLTAEVIGMSSDQAKVNLWRSEQFRIPVKYLGDPALVADLEHLIGRTEETGKSLRRALRVLAENYLVPLSGTGREPDKDGVSKLVSSWPSLPHYWASLENAFYETFARLPNEPEEATLSWYDVLRRTARKALAVATDSLDGSARALKATTQASRSLNGGLRKILEGGE